jgi:hypothetical protein
MPMLDAYIPEGALSPSAERELLAKLTDLLIEHEGSTPATRWRENSPGSSSTALRCTWLAPRQRRRVTASSVRSPKACMTTSVVPR